MAITNSNMKLPKTLAACADLLYETRLARYDLQHEVDDMKKLEAALEERFRLELPQDGASGISGAVARIQLSPKVKPVVEDWDKFYTYVRKNNAFEMLQRRLNEGAARDFADTNGRRVPGTNVMHYTDVSCTAVKR